MRVPLLGAWVLTALPLSAQSPARRVTIPAVDGFRLAAEYLTPGSAGPGALLLHQCNRQGAPTGFESLARRLTTAGLHVLTLDFRGFGASLDAEYRDFSRQMAAIETHFPSDVERAAAYLAAQSGVDGSRLAVVGASCGGWQAVLLAGRRTEVRAIVLLSAAFDDTLDVRPQLLRVADRPLFGVFAEGDRFGTPGSMRAAFAATRHPASQLLVFKGSHHGTPLFHHDRGLEDATVRWLRERLQTP